MYTPQTKHLSPPPPPPPIPVLTSEETGTQGGLLYPASVVCGPKTPGEVLSFYPVCLIRAPALGKPTASLKNLVYLCVLGGGWGVVAYNRQEKTNIFCNGKKSLVCLTFDNVLMSVLLITVYLSCVDHCVSVLLISC